MPRTQITSDTAPLYLQVDATGEGRPVVLIHGWPLSGESWAPQVQALSPHYQVITYDRRGFGRSDKPETGYDYDTLAGDLHGVLEALDLHDVTLVGFSMGGGEVARYISRYGTDRIRSVVFAAAIPPYLLTTDDNPDGPLDEASADEAHDALEQDRDGFLDEFTTMFFSTPDGTLTVTEQQRQDALALARQSDPTAALACQTAFGTTDFRADLEHVTVPTLILHGDSDQAVPLDGSGARTHAAIPGSRLEVIEGAPHGLGVSHADEVNRILLDFLAD